MAELDSLQQALSITFKDTAVLEQALVHRSYLNENTDFPLPSNERLEFLGDALIGFAVTERIYLDFPELPEGELTRLRAALVQQETLARLARSLGLGEQLYLGRGEEGSGGRRRPRNLASTFEAVVGAVLVDQGFSTARDLLLRLLGNELQLAREEAKSADYKSRLQELVQASRQITPTYRIVAATGPEHEPRFTVEVLVGDEVVGWGRGRSKRMAEKEAARVAFERLANS